MSGRDAVIGFCVMFVVILYFSIAASDFLRLPTW